MRETIRTIIQPDYETDHTDSWAGKQHPDIFPAVYRQYRAPSDATEARQMVSDLGDLIVVVNDHYSDARSEAVKMGLDPFQDRATRDKLKQIRSARNRYEAVRRAFIHWLATSGEGPHVVKSIGKTQFSGKDRVDILAAGLKTVVDVMVADLNGEAPDEDLLAKLTALKFQLDVVFP